MALDELKLADGRIVASVLFQLTSGTSKSRSNLSQTLRKKLQWTTFLLSSGEQSLKEKVRAERGEWLAGTAVRFSDVDVTEVNGKVDKGVIDDFAKGIQDNFGLAGPEFCRKIVEDGVHNDPDKVRDNIHRTAAELVELSSEGAAKPDRDGILLRAALPFAIILVAGKLAQSYDILPDYDLTEAIEWAWKRYVASSDAAALDPEQNCIDALQTWIAQKWGVTIKPLEKPSGEHTSNREAEGWFDEECIYIPADNIVKAADVGLKRAEIARILDGKNCLFTTEKGRLTYRRVPGMPGVAVFALDRSMMGPQEGTATVEAMADAMRE